jgi:hypothetical protein
MLGVWKGEMRVGDEMLWLWKRRDGRWGLE